MEVGMLPISASKRGKLLAAGYTTLDAIARASASHLARDIEVSDSEALEILNLAAKTGVLDRPNGTQTTVVGGGQTAWDMLNDEKFSSYITTSCVDLDNILGGGIKCKDVTEIGGVPGIGKTQIGIQLAVNVQIPQGYGGLGGKAIYIDTEGSFMVERVLQIAEACIEDMAEYSNHFHKDLQACEVKMHPNNILENIFYFRVCSYTEQIALINYLDKFVMENKEVKIIIVDSVTFHFRQDFEDMALRTRLLSEMALKFMKLAKKFSLAVVMLNQVTTKFIEGSFQLTLALGDSWSHSCTNRIILFWNGNERHAFIDKSPSLKSASAPYSVTSRGIRNSTSSCKRIKMM
ncbi:DNA repair protein RAD51 homolog 3 [Vigna radiata var. radiata]|uniref:DNA repair protein RAD51 homolog 3 n=1 Tax=Vigna radiata var. radiata TaxID=3916 RepID=A0A1S3V2F1_VIGRR|nr:DNA repair protein RAD51 homolog 3 [Vigna radiata var. radiata]XP_014512353.1 DNA repair protein RAD51 homolog 3 [Vigna radiata var. radiata]